MFSQFCLLRLSLIYFRIASAVESYFGHIISKKIVCFVDHALLQSCLLSGGQVTPPPHTHTLPGRLRSMTFLAVEEAGGRAVGGGGGVVLVLGGPLLVMINGSGPLMVNHSKQTTPEGGGGG